MQEKHSSYTASVHYDRRLYRQDIAGSVAHSRMLARQGIITSEDAQALVRGLESIREEIGEGSFPWREDLEDIHMNVERRLFEKIGDSAGKLHTARSRNDQVALDLRMYAKEAIRDVRDAIRGVRVALVDRAESHARVVMPGYSHLQRAQPVLFAHHMLAYFEMLGRDSERFRQAYARAAAPWPGWLTPSTGSSSRRSWGLPPSRPTAWTPSPTGTLFWTSSRRLPYA